MFAHIVYLFQFYEYVIYHVQIYSIPISNTEQMRKEHACWSRWSRCSESKQYNYLISSLLLYALVCLCMFSISDECTHSKSLVLWNSNNNNNNKTRTQPRLSTEQRSVFSTCTPSKTRGIIYLIAFRLTCACAYLCAHCRTLTHSNIHNCCSCVRVRLRAQIARVFCLTWDFLMCAVAYITYSTIRTFTTHMIA